MHFGLRKEIETRETLLAMRILLKQYYDQQ